MHRMVVGEEDAGELLACPKCGCEFEIPAEEGGGGHGRVVSSSSALYSGMSASDKVQRRMEEQAKHKTTILFRVVGWLSLCASLLVVLFTPWTIVQIWPGLVFSVLIGIVLFFRKSFVNGVFIAGICVLCGVLLWVLYKPPEKSTKQKVRHVQFFKRTGPAPRKKAATAEPTAEKQESEESQQVADSEKTGGAIAGAAVETNTAPEPPAYETYQYDPDQYAGAGEADSTKTETVLPNVEKKVPEMPFVLYDECANPPPFTLDNWLGSQKAIYQDPCWEEQPQSGETCIQVKFNDVGRWGGGAWLAPQGNWGDHPPLYDLSNAERLTFWARGEDGGEVVEFSVGLVALDKQYRDSVYKTTGKIVLDQEWKEYEIDLRGRDLSSVITAFSWALPMQRRRSTFYIDNVRFK
jgi:hypothetical protein